MFSKYISLVIHYLSHTACIWSFSEFWVTPPNFMRQVIVSLVIMSIHCCNLIAYENPACDLLYECVLVSQ